MTVGVPSSFDSSMRYLSLMLATALLACSSSSRGSTEVHEATAAPPTSAEATPPPKEPSPPPSPDLGLDYDRAVGWERWVPFPPGEVSRERDPATYLKLTYASLDDLQLARPVLRGRVPIEDRSLIATPEELCHPNFVQVIQELEPERLLLRVQGDWTAEHLRCVQDLGVDRLYLGLCPDDGATIWRCDGDAQIAALVAAPQLHPLVRGLAFGAGEAASLEVIRSLPNLEYVQLRGPMLETATPEHAAMFCSLPHLRYYDSLDAMRAGVELVPPLPCVLRLRTFIGPHLVARDGWWSSTATPEPEGECALRRIVVWSLDEDDERTLERCASLTEREVAYPDG